MRACVRCCLPTDLCLSISYRVSKFQIQLLVLLLVVVFFYLKPPLLLFLLLLLVNSESDYSFSSETLTSLYKNGRG
jgi:hypothetical protein